MERLSGDPAIWWAVKDICVDASGWWVALGVAIGIVIGWLVGARVGNLAGRKAERRSLASTIRWAHWAHETLVTQKWKPETVDAYTSYCLDFGLKYTGVPKEAEQAAVAAREGAPLEILAEPREPR